MIKQRILLLTFCLAALNCSAFFFSKKVEYTDSVLRVRVTSQAWDFHRPWQKGAPGTRSSFGVLLDNNQVLVPATVVANATFVELERIGTGDKQQATVKVVDYVANLALLQPNDLSFLDGMRAVDVAEKASIDDALEAVQFEANDQLDTSMGTVKDARVVGYPFSVGAFLSYQIKIDLSQSFAGRMVPFFRRGKLVSLGTSYSSTNKIANSIPAPVIQHFLEDAQDGDYQGFPRAGFGYASIEDPALRRYVQLDDAESGVYITTVQPGSAADDSGLKPDDVLTRINGYNIDKHAEYEDPDYGLISVSHLTTTRHFAGEVLDFHVIRKGERIVIPVALTSRDPATWPIEPFRLDRAPQFMIVGGLLIQELSKPFLQAWGGDWSTKAPRNLSRLVRKQWDLAKPGEKFIMLTQVIPTRGTVGYEQIRLKVITHVNGKEIKTMQQAAEAFKSPVDGFHHLQFGNDAPGDLYLAADSVERENAMIKQVYNLPLLQRLEE